MTRIGKTFKLSTRLIGFSKPKVEELITKLILDLENEKETSKTYKDAYQQLAKEHNTLTEKFAEAQKNVERSKYTSEEITRVALKEANVLIERAKRNADLILSEALQNLNAVNRDIANYKQDAKQFRDNVKTLSSTLLNQIETSHTYFLAKEDLNELEASFSEDASSFIKK